jgi:hypothetical protein
MDEETKGDNFNDTFVVPLVPFQVLDLVGPLERHHAEIVARYRDEVSGWQNTVTGGSSVEDQGEASAREEEEEWTIVEGVQSQSALTVSHIDVSR